MAAISGIVTDAVTRRPLAGAVVTLSRIEGGDPLPRMVTDARGRFVFRSLPPATNYYLQARRFGYAPTRYGWTGPGQSLAIRDILLITLTDNQWIDDINIPLWRYGSISGRVVDERGEPLVGVAVRTFSHHSVAGQRQLVAGPLATTDDRGMYRITGVSPGRHVVAVLSVQSTVLVTTPEAPQLRPVGALETGGIGAGRGAFVVGPTIDVDGRHRLAVTNFATPPPPAAGQPVPIRQCSFRASAARPTRRRSTSTTVRPVRASTSRSVRCARSACRGVSKAQRRPSRKRS
jgi:hypothetical protein